MRILGIDTTRKIARLFAYDEGKEFFVNVDENIKHTYNLLIYLTLKFHNQLFSMY